MTVSVLFFDGVFTMLRVCARVRTGLITSVQKQRKKEKAKKLSAVKTEHTRANELEERRYNIPPPEIVHALHIYALFAGGRKSRVPRKRRAGGDSFHLKVRYRTEKGDTRGQRRGNISR